MSWSSPTAWALAVAFSSALAIWGKKPGRMPVHWTFKPMTVLLIIGSVLALTPGTPRTGLLIALGLAWIGDVLLMLPKRYFALGLGAFLAALISYAVTFASDAAWSPWLALWFIGIGSVGVGMVRFLWPHVGRLRIPVAIYVAALVVLTVTMAARQFGGIASPASVGWGIAGALFFVTGDSLLAARRFTGRAVPYTIELGAYFVAQWCLASTSWN